MDVFDLQAKINLDSSGFQKGLSSAASKAKTFAKVGIGAIVGGAALITGAFAKGAKSTAQYGDHVDKMSQKIGISSDSYQKWDYVMRRAGGSVDSLKMGMKTLSQQAEKNSDAFQKLGISQEEVANSSQEELFEKTVKGLASMEQGTERAALASQLLGRAGADMGPLLNEGTDAIAEQMEIAEKYGMVMPEAAVKASAAWQDSMTTLSMTFTGLRNRLMGEFLPSMTEVSDGLSLVFAGDYDKGLSKIDSGISNFISKMSSVLPKVLEIGGRIVSSLGGAIIQNLPELVGSGVEIVTSIITAVIDNLPMIITSMGEVIVAIAQGLAEGIPQIIAAIQAGMPEILAAGKQVFQMFVNGIAENGPELISKAADWVVNLVQGFITSLPKLWTAEADMITKFTNYISENAPKFIEKAGEIVRSLVSGFVQNIPQLVEGAAKLVMAIIEAIGTFAETLIETGIEIINNIALGIKDAVGDKLESAVESIKITITNMIEALKGYLSGAWNAIKSTAASIWGGIKSAAGSAWNGIKSAITKPVTTLKSSLSSAWTAIKTKAASMWDAIKSAVTKPFETAKQKVQEAVNKIKSLFPISLGKIFKGIINLPFIKVNKKKDGADTTGGTKSINFAKAMNEPYVFNRPTNFMAGEAGDEVLFGRSRLMKDISEAVKGNSGSVVVNLNYDASSNANDMLRDLARGVRRYKMAGVI